MALLEKSSGAYFWSERPKITVRLLFVALPLDDARLSGVFETVAGRNKGAPCNKDCDLCPRPVSILFEGIAGQISEATRI
jgi:hypothetical protein